MESQSDPMKILNPPLFNILERDGSPHTGGSGEWSIFLPATIRLRVLLPRFRPP
jgi:hypothetical protein